LNAAAKKKKKKVSLSPQSQCDNPQNSLPCAISLGGIPCPVSLTSIRTTIRFSGAFCVSRPALVISHFELDGGSESSTGAQRTSSIVSSLVSIFGFGLLEGAGAGYVGNIKRVEHVTRPPAGVNLQALLKTKFSR